MKLYSITVYTVFSAAVQHHSSAVHEYSTERQLRPAVAQVHRPASRAPAAGEGGGCCAVQCSAVVAVALASEGGFLSEVWEWGREWVREGSYDSHGLTRGDSQGTRLLQVDTEYRPPADYRPRPAFQVNRLSAFYTFLINQGLKKSKFLWNC